jgi:long-chain acyl-CoA synthetase
MEAKNLAGLFEASVDKYSGNVLFWEKKTDHYKAMTYKEAHERILAYAAGLLELGLKKGDRVALISEGRNDWVISELAILFCGGVCVPLSVKIEEEADLEFRIRHSSCKGIVISGNHQRKAFGLLGKLPDQEFLVLLDGKNFRGATENPDWDSANFPSDEIVELEDLLDRGKAMLEKDPDCVSRISNAIKPDDYANICYTSGTTADPKGIILSHKNYLHNVKQGSAMFEVPEYYTSLHILPWDHSFAHTVGIYTMILNGASLASLKIGKTPNETLRNIPICIKEVRPYFLLSVPALAKNFRKNIEKGVREKGKVAGWLFDKGLKVAYAYNREGYNKGKGLRILIKPLYGLFDKILFSKIRQNFGGRLKFFVGGGALLDIELQRFFYALGMPMYQGYGLTEAAPVISSNNPDNHKLGTSGKIVPFLELKICDDEGDEVPVGQKGEILVKGDNVMIGYWNNEKTTNETLRNGWLHTGDLGYLDNDGYLNVLGRTKSLLISSDGEKYSPEGIEEAIVEKSEFIDQVMLYNNQNPYTTGLILPNKTALAEWAIHHGHDPKTNEGQHAMLQKLQSDLNRFLPGGELDKLFPARWLPSNVYIMKEGFSEQNRMVNSTMKIVRPVIVEFHRDNLEFLYTPEARDICNERNLSSMKEIYNLSPL